MKTISRVTFVALTACLAACQQAPHEPQGPTDAELVAAADELDQKFVEAYNNHDVDAVMALYWNSPDLAVYPPGRMAVYGYDALRESFLNGFEQEKAMGATLETHDGRNQVFGDVVLGNGLWTWTVPVPGGEPARSEGRYTDVKMMVDGRMVFISDHASAPMSAPEAAPADSTAGPSAEADM